MNKLQILRSYFQTKKRMHWSRERIDRWQKRGIKRIIAHAKKCSPFYQALYRDENELQKLPLISKKEMMNSFQDFNVAGISKDEAIQAAMGGEKDGSYDSTVRGITVGLSSGTSGKRGIFLVSKKEAEIWCGNILAKTLTQSIFKKGKVALFLRANSNLYETASSFRYFNLDGDYEKVIAFNPEILVAPPSILRKLPRIHPKKIISVAEVLEPLDRKFLEKKFNQRIDQIYQCTEGFLGFTCEKGALHLNEDVLCIEKEYVDKATGRFLPIITDMFRTTQPMIRYKLDDVLIEGECNCNSSFMAIKCIEGRFSDVLYFKKKNGESALVFPREIGECFSSEYLVKQVKSDLVHLYGGCKKELVKCLAKKDIILPRIITFPKIPERRDDEKLRRVQRDYTID
ncbi:MAG: hypothetical protein KFB93_01580 [Simkaniaceae bacterium]|nr:MAG: hypothetical protein KFB93_01580 [Simkaniaceae bacterium]